MSTKIPSFNLSVGPRPLTPPCSLPNTPPSSVSQAVHCVSLAGRGVANDVVSSTDAGLRAGRVWKLASPPHFPSAHFTLAPVEAGRLLSTSFCSLRLTIRDSVLCNSPTSGPVRWPFTFPSGVISISFDLHTSPNETGKVSIRNIILEIRKQASKGYKARMKACADQRVCGRAGFKSHLLFPGPELFPTGHSSSQFATSEEGSGLVPWLWVQSSNALVLSPAPGTEGTDNYVISRICERLLCVQGPNQWVTLGWGSPQPGKQNPALTPWLLCKIVCFLSRRVFKQSVDVCFSDMEERFDLMMSKIPSNP